MIVKRDVGQEILESIQSIKKGYGLKGTFEIPQDVCKVRKQL